MEEQVKVATKKRLSPEATILLTIGTTALGVVLYRIVYFIATGN